VQQSRALERHGDMPAMHRAGTMVSMETRTALAGFRGAADSPPMEDTRSIAVSPPVRGTIGKGVIGLLAVAVFINYVDRGNLATAAPLIRDELHLSNTQLGVLLSAFFWSYTPGQILAGWLAEKINAYRTLALGLAIWSAATAGSGLVGSFTALIMLRLVLGLGESAAFPCSSKIFAEHLPAQKLGSANGLISVGLALGPAFGTFAGGMLMAHAGWRSTFLVFGLASMLWLAPWLRATRQASSHADANKADGVPSFFAILGQVRAWGASLGHFSANYSLYFVISWLPLYLVKVRGFSVSQMAELGGVVYVIYAISAQTTGWLSDRWMKAGASSTRVRKTFLVCAHAGTAVCMVVCAMGGPSLSIAGLLASGIFFGCCTPHMYAVAQTLAGPRAGGKWMALQNCVGNLAGITAPLVTGIVVDRTGSFGLAFLAAAGVALAGAFCWGVVIRRIDAVDWNGA
jgi:MFS family permease